MMDSCGGRLAEKSTGHRVHTWVRTHLSLVYMMESSFSEDISVLPPMNRGT